ncbi:MAG: DUF2252 domain-containing protein, partial [Ilumatobacteraceae bacterium]|nr:DUF2252 domain-containing protein [Ilumatobacteraceae bacterium]
MSDDLHLEGDDESQPLPPGMRYEHGRVVPHLTVEERIARGRAARREVPRSSHADFRPSEHRPDPVDLLEHQAMSRVPELVPIRYGRMVASPFAFYRGGALIMAADMAGTPRSGLVTQICGDAHLMNFGVYASPERRMVFDINDFDETLPGPWEWDVKRLAASFEIAARANGFSGKDRARVVAAVVEAYRTGMSDLAERSNLDVWYARLDVEDLMRDLRDHMSSSARKRVQANIAKARSRDRLQALAKLTHVVDGRRRIISDPPLVVPIDELAGDVYSAEQINDLVRGVIRSYRQSLQSDRRHLLEEFQVVHAARKVVGVGSVGTRAWIALLSGRDDDDPLFLQVKEAQRSVLEDFAGASRYATSGARVVHGQHLMQASSDIFLGWERITGVDGETRDYYVRQLRDGKGSAEVETMRPSGLAIYAKLCGWTLARAHARSGDRIAIASYLGTSDAFDRALVEFAAAYADQNERDHAALAA